MKLIEPSSAELEEILIWERSYQNLTPEQKSLCVVLNKSTEPVPEAELCKELNCSAEYLIETQKGIYGILIDSSNRKYHIK